MLRYLGRDEDRIRATDPLEILAECGGKYSCPKDGSGRRFGPLVGYAGEYDVPDPTDEQPERKKKLQYVGDDYLNFAKTEQHAVVRRVWAKMMASRLLCERRKIDVALGAPMGGILFASSLGDILECRAPFAEKKGSGLEFDRHDLEEGDRVVIVEDVCNNFSTTKKLCDLVTGCGAFVVAIVCILNRSDRVSFSDGSGDYPVLSVVHKQFPEYRQDNPFVAADVLAGNLVRKPKVRADWARLQALQSVSR